jgi:hypothetical protein
LYDPFSSSATELLDLVFATAREETACVSLSVSVSCCLCVSVCLCSYVCLACLCRQFKIVLSVSVTADAQCVDSERGRVDSNARAALFFIHFPATATARIPACDRRVLVVLRHACQSTPSHC